MMRLSSIFKSLLLIRFQFVLGKFIDTANMNRKPVPAHLAPIWLDIRRPAADAVFLEIS
jgi:hypothetical protein